MKKSNFFAGIMFLAAAVAFKLAFAQTGLQYSIVTDSSGGVVGQIDPSWWASLSPEEIAAVNGTNTTKPVTVSVVTYTPDQLKAMGVPVTSLSSLAPAPTTTQTTVKVTVPYSVPVAFCSGGNYYNKGTGLCADGKFPYKVVPLNSLKDPAAQVATIVCRAPTVPTWNPAMKKWNCIVPAGFKNTLGE
jgi:hypothetical protein